METTDRIALFLPSLNGGGAERVMVNLAQGLAASGVSTDMVLARATGTFIREVPSSVRIFDLQADHVRYSIRGLIHYLKQTRPKVLLSAMGHANLAALIARRIARTETRVFVSIHASMSRTSWSEHPLKKRLYPFISNRFYPWADGIITVSKGAAKDLAEMAGIPLQSISVIYNPIVSAELFDRAKEPVEHPWFRAGAPAVIMGMGRLVKQKDFPTLIRAFAIVHQQSDARLVILGEGSDRRELEALVARLGLKDVVSLPGFVENPFAYLAKSALFVLSSAWEGFGNVLVEAMALGVPIISTSCPSGPDEILEDGRYGDLVPVGDEQRMATKILARLQQGVSNQEIALLKQRSNCFTLSNITQDYLRLMS